MPYDAVRIAQLVSRLQFQPCNTAGSQPPGQSERPAPESTTVASATITASSNDALRPASDSP